MNTVLFTSVRDQFQYLAGLSALDSWETTFFETALNRRLKQAWEYAKWPAILEISEVPVNEISVVGAKVKCLKDHPIKQPPSTGLVIGDIVTLTGVYSTGSLKWAGSGGFDAVNQLGKGGTDSWDYTEFPDEDVLNAYDRNPYTDKYASEIDFNLIDGRVHLDPSYTDANVWLLKRKPFVEVSSSDSVPAIFQSYLVSGVLADFYRSDGQQNKAQYEEAVAEEALLKQLDRIERQSQQDGVSIITHQAPNKRRYAKV